MFADTDNFAKRLGRALGSSGISARQVALRAGVSPPYLSDLAAGNKANPSPIVIKKLAAALAVSKEWLTEGTGEMLASEEERALAESILEGGRTMREEAAVYGASLKKGNESSRLHREILQRLDEAFESVDDMTRAKLHQRLDEFLDVVQSKQAKQ